MRTGSYEFIGEKTERTGIKLAMVRDGVSYISKTTTGFNQHEMETSSLKTMFSVKPDLKQRKVLNFRD